MLPPFEIDDRIPMKIDFDLAVRVGEFIVNSGTPDKQIMAFGHRLLALDHKQEPDQPRKWIPRPSRADASARRLSAPSHNQDGFGEGIE